jgi:hypothetical protein
MAKAGRSLVYVNTARWAVESVYLISSIPRTSALYMCSHAIRERDYIHIEHVVSLGLLKMTHGEFHKRRFVEIRVKIIEVEQATSRPTAFSGSKFHGKTRFCQGMRAAALLSQSSSFRVPVSHSSHCPLITMSRSHDDIFTVAKCGAPVVGLTLVLACGGQIQLLPLDLMRLSSRQNGQKGAQCPIAKSYPLIHVQEDFGSADEFGSDCRMHDTWVLQIPGSTVQLPPQQYLTWQHYSRFV